MTPAGPWVEVRPGAYHDSVTLMRVSRALRDLPGVQAAQVAMATGHNRDLFAGLGFAVPDTAGPDDLVIAVRAADPAVLEAAAARVADLLAPAAGGHGGSGGLEPVAEPARTTASAARRVAAGLVLVSVPGEHAFTEAADALAAGLSVMVFSDNVPLEQEIALKDMAAERGLIVLGPDCGTALIGGVGLGFANAVRPGPVGLVAASGTGAQQVMCLLDAAGVGVSQVIGVGGRDLSEEVAGRSTLAALAALDADPATELIVVISKPPAADVAERIRAAATRSRTPVVTALLGPGRPDLTAATEHVLREMGRRPPRWPTWAPGTPPEAHPGARPGARPGALRGLFAGGTLCHEALLIAAERLAPVRSNLTADPRLALPGDLRAPGHLLIDFGDDRLTLGRPHPMIDPTSRLARLEAEAADPECGVILLDVVLGYAADPDPAAALAPAIAAARPAHGGPAVVVSLCGASGDPQGLERQADALAAAGARVLLSNAAAARLAVRLVEESAGSDRHSEVSR